MKTTRTPKQRIRYTHDCLVSIIEQSKENLVRWPDDGYFKGLLRGYEGALKFLEHSASNAPLSATPDAALPKPG